MRHVGVGEFPTAVRGDARAWRRTELPRRRTLIARDGSRLGEEEGRLESEREYLAIFEAAPDGILVVDADGRILDVNPAAERMFGYEREEFLGAEVETLVPEGARETHVDERGDFFDDPHARPMGIGMELHGRREDGSVFPVEISLSPLHTGEGTMVISTVRDVTERRRLRQFGAGALHAAEEERRRIARELHDDTAQRLAGLLIRLRLARRAQDPEERDRLLDEVREEVLASAEAVRRIARGLRPPALEDAGLGTALYGHVRQRLASSALEASVEIEPVEDRLDEEAKLAVYRIVQEALSNVIRHAEAETVRIRVHGKDGHVEAEVTDDGRGFAIPESVDRLDGGLGIVGMRERAAIAGGELELESVPGRGTTVRVRIPTREEEIQDG